MCRGHVHIAMVQAELHVQRTTRFAAPEAEILAGHFHNGQPGQQSVSVLPGGAVQRDSPYRIPRPPLAEKVQYPGILPEDFHFLQSNDIGIDGPDDFAYAIRLVFAIRSNAAVDVVARQRQ